MGTLDRTSGSEVKKKIAVLDITGNTPAQIEIAYTNNWGSKGWRVIQIVVISTKTYVIMEKEL